tara:strand:+ start:811 stop:1236 length:426 start_codon:yes stop_codon:yes gene_type:complete
MKKILIVNANYYKDISDNLILCAKNELIKKKFKLKIINVPGVFEIPFMIRKNIKKFDGFIALGCVVKGKTPHFDLICNSVFNSILQISISFNKPIGNGIITCLNLNQAKERSGLKTNITPNKGEESAKAIISVLKNEPKNI